jgi:class 3 adenylate cyclase
MIDGSFPDIRYADADGVAIAYAVSGEGPIDFVFVPGVQSGLMGSTLMAIDVFDERVRSFGRMIRLDRRGMGVSDPLPQGVASPLEQQVGDVLAVMDAVGSERAALYGISAGASVALLCAAMHPERVQAIITYLGFARYFAADDYPIGRPLSERDETLRTVRERWGDLERPYAIEHFGTLASDPELVRAFARGQQLSSSRHAAVATIQVVNDSDIRAVLPLVQAPTLVVYPEWAGFFRDAGEYLAQHLPHATTFVPAGANTLDFTLGQEVLVDTVEEFVTGVRPVERTDRILATVLFTDIVASTENAAALGDQQWRQRLDTHDQIVRDELARAGGREVKHTGDGFLAAFDGPARAINCARAINRRAATIGIRIRTGIHVGECERRGDDLAGIAIHTCARVCALAGPGEIAVTSTVRDLTAGSGIDYIDFGTHTLKGVPDPRQLYQVN